jgi:hypothetical protein
VLYVTCDCTGRYCAVSTLTLFVYERTLRTRCVVLCCDVAVCTTYFDFGRHDLSELLVVSLAEANCNTMSGGFAAALDSTLFRSAASDATPVSCLLLASLQFSDIHPVQHCVVNVVSAKCYLT